MSSDPLHRYRDPSIKPSLAKIDHLVGLALCVGYILWLLPTARSLGFSRDESFYFHAARDYAQWFDLLVDAPRKAISRAEVDRLWGYNHEHPSLMKGLFALSWKLLYVKAKLFTDESTAFRFPGMVFGGLGLWVTYLFGARTFNRRTGVIAALLLAFIPRPFYHAHLACFDVPVMTMWIVSIYAYWRTLQKPSFGRIVVAGLIYGLCLETKHNAWILPIVFVAHAIASQVASKRRQGISPAPFPWALVAMAVLGPLVFLGLWPWQWYDTANRVREYMQFHLHHDYYNIEYLHKNYYAPPAPISYAPVMIFATVPGITLFLFAGGFFERIRGLIRRVLADIAQLTKRNAPRGFLPHVDGAETDLLWTLAFLAPLAPFFLPATPIFGGTKHWFPAYPFLCLFAARGADLTLAACRRAFYMVPAKKMQFAEIALAALLVLPAAIVTAHSHPFGLSSYTPFVGGTRGGASLGLHRQFWGYTTQSVDSYLEPRARPGDGLFLHDTTWWAFEQMQKEHRLPAGIFGTANPDEARFAVIQHELHMNENEFNMWNVYDTPSPDYVLTQDDVPIISLWDRLHGARK
jgi:4-amino-4-deoxy-L-arabinose transferase-like glycosyltransferase